MSNNLDDVYNFHPNSEDERIFFETHSSLSQAISKMIRSVPTGDRFVALKNAVPTDTTLMALYLWALKKEDYETCSVAKELLLERGLKIPR